MVRPVVRIAAGDAVTAGTVNCDGSLVIRATAAGDATVLADIVRLVDMAQARAAPVQRLADAVAGRFAYGVIGASAATFCFWTVLGPQLFPQVLHPPNLCTADCAAYVSEPEAAGCHG